MPAPALLETRSPRGRASLRRRLEALHRTFDRSYLGTDPLAFVHRYDEPADQEIVGFVAAGLAFGNVVAIRGSLTRVLAVMGDSPSGYIERFDAGREAGSLRHLYHRWIRPADFAALFATLRSVRRSHGSVRDFFLEGQDPSAKDVGPALASFSGRARALAPTGADTAGLGPSNAARFFASPRDGSACKRLNLYLRWMVRGGDGLDLGLWPGIPRRQLVLPLDTHLARLARALGLTHRRTPGWEMAVEATRSLSLLDPDDPVKYDFALSRLGILDLCVHGRDPLDCRRCPIPRVRRIRFEPRRGAVPEAG